jgi:hypothetical protein
MFHVFNQLVQSQTEMPFRSECEACALTMCVVVLVTYWIASSGVPEEGVVVSRQSAGGLSETKLATAAIQMHVERVTLEFKHQYNLPCGKLVAVSYKSQVVNGQNYFVKVRCDGAAVPLFAHLRLHLVSTIFLDSGYSPVVYSPVVYPPVVLTCNRFQEAMWHRLCLVI